MAYWGWNPYASVAERRKNAERVAAKARKAGADLLPIAPNRGAIAKTFWGKAWCDNLERYSDFSNRLPRGRAYVRNGSVIDLRITAGGVRAQVMGSRLYTVDANITAVPTKQWQAIGADCTGSIDSLVELLQGRLSKAVMERICKPGIGLFPAPNDIRFRCSCPDWASMCKHVAAVLYGVGARLDHQPELLFELRRVDAKDLVAKAGSFVPKAKDGFATNRLLDESAIANVFGIEMVDIAPPSNRRRKPATAKVGKARPKSVPATTAKRSSASKSGTVKKLVAKKQVKAKGSAKSSPTATKVVRKSAVHSAKAARHKNQPGAAKQ
jgi:uncharacterized Zn finger protein